MPRPPLVSVLLPAYNAEATLDACLRSLRRQSESRWECVLVDDGSTDDTGALAEEHAARDPRIVPLTLAHGGIVAALEAGLSRCRGRYVARMDADDLMHRHRLREQAGLLQADEGLAGVGCHVRLFPRRRIGAGMREYERWINSVIRPEDVERQMWVECPLAHPTLMLRRPVLERVGYRDRGWPEDYDLLLRLIGAGHRLGTVARRRLLWRIHDRRLSRDSGVYSVERFTACKAAHLRESLLRDSPRYILWGYGATGRELRRALLRHDRRPAYIVEVHPGRMAQKIHEAEVVPPARLAGLPRLPLLASVAGERPRGEIRRYLDRLGWVENRDYVCVA